MIREAYELDIEQIYDLGNLINEHFSVLNNINQYLEDNTKKIYVYEKDFKVVSFIILNIFELEMEILDIMVDKNYRNKGIASSLLNFVFETYQRDCFLEVRFSNKEAINLYKKNNFEVIYIREKYYNNIEDAYTMKRGIK